MADCKDFRVYKRLKAYLQWIVYFKKEKHGDLGGGGGGGGGGLGVGVAVDIV